MATEAVPAVRPITVAEYHRMGELGFFGPDERTELVEGVIYRMAPEGPRHGARSRRLLRALGPLAGQAAQLSTSSLVVGASELVPDAALLRWRDDFYEGALPTAADALLVVEVSDATLRFDVTTKARLYAAAGVPEYWVLDVAASALVVLTDPGPDGYRDARTVRTGRVTPGTFPNSGVDVADLLG
jgi:Uma2 family endonuclease